MSLYSIVWKYRVRRGMEAIFESEYGSGGAWDILFSKSVDYKGSYLHQSEDHPNHFLLIDTWKDKASYEVFMNNNEKAYESLSSSFQHLYESEEKIGTFHAID